MLRRRATAFSLSSCLALSAGGSAAAEPVVTIEGSGTAIPVRVVRDLQAARPNQAVTLEGFCQGAKRSFALDVLQGRESALGTDLKIAEVFAHSDPAAARPLAYSFRVKSGSSRLTLFDPELAPAAFSDSQDLKAILPAFPLLDLSCGPTSSRDSTEVAELELLVATKADADRTPGYAKLYAGRDKAAAKERFAAEHRQLLRIRPPAAAFYQRGQRGAGSHERTSLRWASASGGWSADLVLSREAQEWKVFLIDTTPRDMRRAKRESTLGRPVFSATAKAGPRRGPLGDRPGPQ